ncbi:GGDEF domain-containing protein [Marinomonas atlantica]|uniref:GGDEF domain-containing protein n=1 Tax=Marinomonas atlantica TaxID=1806668 RepID=UPI0008303317|nr:diguanylate cyclase [Marinomonas atlantica]MCO4784921.1 diguanylate cyclase [Marinomonas atlantica]
MPDYKKQSWHLICKRWFSVTLNAGAINHSFTNNSRRTFIINLFCLVGVLFTAPLGILSLVEGNVFVGLSLLLIATVYILNHLYLRRTRNYLFSANVILYPLYTLMLYLVYSGGVNGTGHVWIYCIPPVSLFLHGLKRGLLEVFLFLIALTFILFVTPTPFDELGYHPDLKTRIIYSFILIAFLSTIYEYISSRFNQSLQELSVKLEIAATTDPLTGLLNRRGLQQRLEELLWPAPALLLLDIDYFKQINDEFGHKCGDEYLVLFAQTIEMFSLEHESLVSRWGGEEFLVVLEKTDNLKDVSEALRKKLGEITLSTETGANIAVTVSIGVTQVEAGESILKAISRADQGLYAAKNRGRNRVEVVEKSCDH